jgi:hypothetical protein
MVTTVLFVFLLVFQAKAAGTLISSFFFFFFFSFQAPPRPNIAAPQVPRVIPALPVPPNQPVLPVLPAVPPLPPGRPQNAVPLTPALLAEMEKLLAPLVLQKVPAEGPVSPPGGGKCYFKLESKLADKERDVCKHTMGGLDSLCDSDVANAKDPSKPSVIRRTFRSLLSFGLAQAVKSKVIQRVRQVKVGNIIVGSCMDATPAE